MDRTGKHNIQPNSKGQILHVFVHMQNLDLKCKKKIAIIMELECKRGAVG
jgi:hypothetical protein